MTVAVVPVRSFRDGMHRLSPVLNRDQRARLGQAVAERVVTTVLEADIPVLVVSSDAGVSRWAASLGCSMVEDPGRGLSSAVTEGVVRSAEFGARWLVIHADLPLIHADDVATINAGIEEGAEVIAPSVEGGTTVLSASRSIEFSYGEGSFLRHLALLHQPSIVVTDGLLQDVDTPDDLKAVTDHHRGRWLEGIY